MKKILIVFFIGMFLIIGTTFAITISNGIIIDKVGNKYTIYKKSYEINANEVSDKISKKNLEINRLNQEKLNLETNYLGECKKDRCKYQCEEQVRFYKGLKMNDCLFSCKEWCDTETMVRKEGIDERIIKINEEIGELNEVLKIK